MTPGQIWYPSHHLPKLTTGVAVDSTRREYVSRGNHWRVSLLLGALLVSPYFQPWFGQTTLAAEGEPTSRQVEYFESKIRPILIEHCHECHSGQAGEVQGGLSLEHREGLMAGGDSGPAIVPGEPEKSLLLMALRYDGLEMPPNGKLPQSVIDDFATWISMGGYGPPAAETESTSDRPIAPRRVDLDRGREFWAFQPLVASLPPDVANRDWAANWIDLYVIDRLEQAGLSPAPDVDRARLLRRLTFDLTGLPPTIEQQEAFLSDERPDAIERVVDALLASPRFGEQWGRHWLDVARYADSNGNDFNATFHDAWRYRNYVIDAMNRDKPYNRFVREQLAGDLLSHDNAAQQSEQLIATGFLMVGTKMLSERDKQKMLMDVVDEQVDTIGRVFMGLTLGCARCHDHKFDPIPTTDYYALAGILKSTTSFEGESQRYVSTWTPQPLPIDPIHAERLRAFEQEQASLTNRESELKKSLEQLGEVVEKTSVEAAASAANNADNTVTSDVSLHRQALQEELTALEERRKVLLASSPPPAPTAFAVREADDIGDCQVCIRGESHNLGPIVPRGFLQVVSLSLAESSQASTLATAESGRRELAAWITDPRHPLTARVFVNRVWQKLMGEGLVRTVDNFGTLGELPTHPELLDRLAIDFMKNGWSIKHVVRQVVLSRAYRLDSTTSAVAAERDPKNQLWSRANRRRILAESLRDSLLAVAGDLDLSIGEGPVNHLGTLVTQNRPDAEAAASQESRQRTIYQPVIRGQLPPLLMVFDFADPDFVVGQRPVTTTPAQALLMLNSPLIMRQADRIVDWLLGDDVPPGHESPIGVPAGALITWDARLTRLYRQLYGRLPTEDEIRDVIAHGLALRPEYANRTQDGDAWDPSREMWRDVVHAMLAGTEFRLLD